MDRAAIREFADRDRITPARLKSDWWTELRRRSGLAEGIRMSDELRRHVMELRPDWPDPASRERDLQDHIELGRQLRRVRSSRVP